MLHADLAQHLLAGLCNSLQLVSLLACATQGGSPVFSSMWCTAKGHAATLHGALHARNFGHTSGSQPLLHVDERKCGRQHVQPVPLATMTSDAAYSLGALEESPLTSSETCVMHLSAQERCHMSLPRRPTTCPACAYFPGWQIRLQVAPAFDNQGSTKDLKSCHSRFVQVCCSPCSRPSIPSAASTGAAQSPSSGTGRPGQAALSTPQHMQQRTCCARKCQATAIDARNGTYTMAC